MTTKATPRQPHPPTPGAPPPIDDLPHALTFFVSHRDRGRIIGALRRIHTDRATALLTALGLSTGDHA
jgi:hypothetical protein